MTSDKQIFIAEDNTDMQEIYRTIFVDLTDSIHLVKDGIEAIKYLSANTPNLMILDINMPGMSGLEVLRHIKQEDRFSDVKTIIVTSNAPAMNSEISSLADLFVTKPVDVFHLKILAERLLSQA
ncbi:MAG: response regulator [Chloroflexi bacterium]|nr:response regulator [Chloroflexota bacterium]MCC6895505.1 response regulator [Anaerolineae bacterium]